MIFLLSAAGRISIHAPRTGSDWIRLALALYGSKISIHAPRTGSDVYAKLLRNKYSHFNPRSPHGERQP